MWRCALTFRMAEVSLEQLIKLSSGSDVERGEELPELPNAGTCICPTNRECVSLREVEPMANATCQRTQTYPNLALCLYQLM